MLAGTIGERNFWHYGELEASFFYINNVLEDSGYEVSVQEYTIEGKTFKNIVAEISGASISEEIVIVGAHYDSAFGTPGANDNASGVAALLDIARFLAKEKPSRTVRFVFFANEEPPFFHTSTMGSRIYAARSRERGERIVAMLSLETIGYYSDELNSQHYPFPFGLLYPDTGNFIGFVGNTSSRRLLRQAIGSFRSQTAFPSEGIAAPGWIPGIDWSDQWSFWEEGYPAIMITDTAPFRFEYYHTPEDTPDKIDFDKLSRIVSGLLRVVVEIAGGLSPQAP